MDSTKIRELLYGTSLSQLKKYVESTTDDKDLYLIAYNYNWDDGLSIPKAILDNKACSLSTALLIFYLAEGEQSFLDDDYNKNSQDGKFVIKLRKDIKEGKFSIGDIAFEIPLTKVQVYKLKKCLSQSESVFVTPIIGENMNISL